MKNNYIYRVRAVLASAVKEGKVVADLGYWLSLGTAKADIKRMKENGILDAYYTVCVEQIKIGRYHVPDTKLHMKKKNGKWVTVD